MPASSDSSPKAEQSALIFQKKNDKYKVRSRLSILLFVKRVGHFCSATLPEKISAQTAYRTTPVGLSNTYRRGDTPCAVLPKDFFPFQKKRRLCFTCFGSSFRSDIVVGEVPTVDISRITKLALQTSIFRSWVINF